MTPPRKRPQETWLDREFITPRSTEKRARQHKRRRRLAKIAAAHKRVTVRLLHRQSTNLDKALAAADYLARLAREAL